MTKGFSQFFDSFSVNGDKITIHKCVIDAAIKRVKIDPDPFEDGERVRGKLDVLEDLSDVIRTGMNIERSKRIKKGCQRT